MSGMIIISTNSQFADYVILSKPPFRLAVGVPPTDFVGRGLPRRCLAPQNPPSTQKFLLSQITPTEKTLLPKHPNQKGLTSPFFVITYYPSAGRLAQVARARARHARGHRFESCTAHLFGFVGQMFGFTARLLEEIIKRRAVWARAAMSAHKLLRRWVFLRYGLGKAGQILSHNLSRFLVG